MPFKKEEYKLEEPEDEKQTDQILSELNEELKKTTSITNKAIISLANNGIRAAKSFVEARGEENISSVTLGEIDRFCNILELVANKRNVVKVFFEAIKSVKFPDEVPSQPFAVSTDQGSFIPHPLAMFPHDKDAYYFAKIVLKPFFEEMKGNVKELMDNNRYFLSKNLQMPVIYLVKKIFVSAYGNEMLIDDLTEQLDFIGKYYDEIIDYFHRLNSEEKAALEELSEFPNEQLLTDENLTPSIRVASLREFHNKVKEIIQGIDKYELPEREYFISIYYEKQRKKTFILEHVVSIYEKYYQLPVEEFLRNEEISDEEKKVVERFMAYLDECAEFVEFIDHRKGGKSLFLHPDRIHKEFIYMLAAEFEALQVGGFLREMEEISHAGIGNALERWKERFLVINDETEKQEEPEIQLSNKTQKLRVEVVEEIYSFLNDILQSWEMKSVLEQLNNEERVNKKRGGALEPLSSPIKRNLDRFNTDFLVSLEQLKDEQMDNDTVDLNDLLSERFLNTMLLALKHFNNHDNAKIISQVISRTLDLYAKCDMRFKNLFVFDDDQGMTEKISNAISLLKDYMDILPQLFHFISEYLEISEQLKDSLEIQAVNETYFFTWNAFDNNLKLFTYFFEFTVNLRFDLFLKNIEAFDKKSLMSAAKHWERSMQASIKAGEIAQDSGVDKKLITKIYKIIELFLKKNIHIESYLVEMTHGKVGKSQIKNSKLDAFTEYKRYVDLVFDEGYDELIEKIKNSPISPSGAVKNAQRDALIDLIKSINGKALVNALVSYLNISQKATDNFRKAQAAKKASSPTGPASSHEDHKPEWKELIKHVPRKDWIFTIPGRGLPLLNNLLSNIPNLMRLMPPGVLQSWKGIWKIPSSSGLMVTTLLSTQMRDILDRLRILGKPHYKGIIGGEEEIIDGKKVTTGGEKVQYGHNEAEDVGCFEKAARERHEASVRVLRTNSFHYPFLLQLFNEQGRAIDRGKVKKLLTRPQSDIPRRRLNVPTRSFGHARKVNGVFAYAIPAPALTQFFPLGENGRYIDKHGQPFKGHDIHLPTDNAQVVTPVKSLPRSFSEPNFKKYQRLERWFAQKELSAGSVTSKQFNRRKYYPELEAGSSLSQEPKGEGFYTAEQGAQLIALFEVIVGAGDGWAKKTHNTRNRKKARNKPDEVRKKPGTVDSIAEKLQSPVDLQSPNEVNAKLEQVQQLCEDAAKNTVIKTMFTFRSKHTTDFYKRVNNNLFKTSYEETIDDLVNFASDKLGIGKEALACFQQSIDITSSLVTKRCNRHPTNSQ